MGAMAKQLAEADQGHPACFGREPLHLSPMRRRLPVDSGPGIQSRKDDVSGEIPERWCFTAVVVAAVYYGQKKRETVRLIGRWPQRKPVEKGRVANRATVKGAGCGQTNRHRRVRG